MWKMEFNCLSTMHSSYKHKFLDLELDSKYPYGSVVDPITQLVFFFFWVGGGGGWDQGGTYPLAGCRAAI